jgi:hypothetical protein
MIRTVLALALLALAGGVHAERLQEIARTDDNRTRWMADAEAVDIDENALAVTVYMYKNGTRVPYRYAVARVDCANGAGTLYAHRLPAPVREDTIQQYPWVVRGGTVSDQLGMELCATLRNFEAKPVKSDRPYYN